MPDSLIATARKLWTALPGTPPSFPEAAGCAVSIDERSALCPPSWTGIVAIDGAAIASTPHPTIAAVLTDSLNPIPDYGCDVATLLGAKVSLDAIHGPASLAYLAPAEFRNLHDDTEIDVLPDSSAKAVRDVLRTAPADEVAESDLFHMTSPLFVRSENDAVTAAAGYRILPHRIAHFGVFTHPTYRGNGSAKLVASAAVAHALSQGYTPQWRAQPAASRGVGIALGFRKLGWQLVLKPTVQ